MPWTSRPGRDAVSRRRPVRDGRARDRPLSELSPRRTLYSAANASSGSMPASASSDAVASFPTASSSAFPRS